MFFSTVARRFLLNIPRACISSIYIPRLAVFAAASSLASLGNEDVCAAAAVIVELGADAQYLL